MFDHGDVKLVIYLFSGVEMRMEGGPTRERRRGLVPVRAPMTVTGSVRSSSYGPGDRSPFLEGQVET